MKFQNLVLEMLMQVAATKAQAASCLRATDVELDRWVDDEGSLAMKSGDECSTFTAEESK